ncbi:MAG: SusC/RagA family TonB-linked outer membrane protein [Bacteroidales bacterium]|jgi:TonB-linked SusC/RagA family outer membrane protein
MKKLRIVFAALLITAGSVLSAQNIRITGSVTEIGTGTVLPFVNIQVKGTNIGTATLDNGSYAITAPSNGTLVFSFLGFKTLEVPVQNRTTINLQLQPDAVSLNEVVTIAYGVAKKESVTGAISTVNSKAIEKRPVSSVFAALEGQAAGVQVNNTYGEPGADPVIRIRGFSSINGSNAPLYVIDGVPFGGNISDLNPADIESMSVLKDASSSALFGNRASNGVIMITTKKGKSNIVSVRANINQGIFTRGVKEYDKLDSKEFMEIMWKGYRNSLMTSQPTKYPTAELAGAEATKTLIPTYLKYNIFNKPDNALFGANGKVLDDARSYSDYDDLDWFKYMERLGHRQDYVVSADGASEKQNYFFSIGYLDEKGYVKSSDFTRFTGRANISVTPKKWFKTGLSLSGTHQIFNNSYGSAIDNANSFINPFMYARTIAPIYPVYLHDMATGEYILDANGGKQYDSGGQYSRPQYAGRHVIWEYELNTNKTFRNTLNSQVFADISFLNDFTFSIKGDMSLRDSENRTYRNITIGDGAGTGTASKEINRYKSYTLQQLLTWKKEFGRHEIDILAAHENFYHNQSLTYGYKTTEVFKGGPEFINFTVISALDGYQRDYRTESYLSRVRYNYDNRIYFDASYRRDGTSKFYPDTRWGNFWSVGGSWTVSKEPFMASLNKQINSLKLRASYGEVGNDGGTSYSAIDFQAYMALYALNQNGNRGAAYKIQNEALDLIWETSGSLGVGIDGRFFDRLNLSAEYFDKRSQNLLFDVYLPLSAGATSTDRAESTVKKNLGSVSNRGIELSLDYDLIKRGDFRWNVGVISTILKNKIISLPEQNRANGIISGSKKYMEGHDIYEFWMYQFAGVDQMTGNSLYLVDFDKYYVGDAVEGKTAVPAQWLETINGTNYTRNISYAKQDWSGSAIPDLFGSFTTSISYKNFDLSALFTYSIGGKTYDNSYQDLMSVTATPGALHKNVLKAWDGVPSGMTATSPDRIDPTGIPVNNFQLSPYNNASTTQYLKDASYMVIKNITLGYRLPRKIVSKLDISDFSINISIDNLATFNKLRGMDSQQSFGGVTDNGFVASRVFSVGVNVKL